LSLITIQRRHEKWGLDRLRKTKKKLTSEQLGNAIRAIHSQFTKTGARDMRFHLRTEYRW
jgi:hypothetical protein